MFFVALTSAYIVRKSQGNWYEFRLPEIFYYSSAVILLSSVVLHASYMSFLKGNEKLYKGLLSLSFLLGASFLGLQYLGWTKLNSMGIYMDTNPSAAFVFAITLIHAMHLLVGLIVLLVALLMAFSQKYEVTPLRKLRFELTLTIWHFFDILWIYLIVFVLTQ
ncbi:MAG: hypothetical protein RI894_1403 [Bacteroidota bacterium]